MNDQLRARQMLHQQAGTACMIKMHVRENDVVDIVR
jgi:hypothetical protein